MKKLSVMLCLIALLAFTLNGCGGSGTTDTSYYGGGDSGGTTTTPTVTSCTTNLTPGQTCSIGGSGFGSSRDSGASTVSFVPQVTGGTTLTATTYLSWSDTAIQCVTPSVVTGIQYVVIVNRYTSSGTVSSSSTGSSANMTTGTAATAAPSVTSQSPNPATAGASVTLTGTNFPISYGYILVNGTVVSSTFTTTTAVFTVPSTVTANATVTLGGGVGGSTTYTLIVSGGGGAATITSISPNPVNAGSAITITGTNFGTAGTVTIAGTTATTTAWTATSITATVPASTTPGTVAVVVTPTGGTASSPSNITVAGATTPTLQTVTPSSGAAGATVTLTGTNLGTTGTITFGTVAAVATAWTATSITTTVPATAVAGATTISVTPTGSTAATIAFTVTGVGPITGTWQGSATVNTGTTGAPAANTFNMHALPNGNIAAIYIDNNGTRNGIYASFFVQTSSTWTARTEIDRVALVNPPGNLVHSAIDSSGNIIAVWGQNDGTSTRIYYNYYTYSTGAWLTNAGTADAGTPIASAVNVVTPQVAFDSNNDAVCVWRNIPASANSDQLWANKYVTGAAAWGGTTANLAINPNVYVGSTNLASPRVGFLPGSRTGFVVWVQSPGTANQDAVYARSMDTSKSNFATPSGNVNDVFGNTTSRLDYDAGHTGSAVSYNSRVPQLHFSGTTGCCIFSKDNAAVAANIYAARYVAGTWVAPTGLTQIIDNGGIAAGGTGSPAYKYLSSGDGLLTWVSTSVLASYWTASTNQWSTWSGVPSTISGTNANAAVPCLPAVACDSATNAFCVFYQQYVLGAAGYWRLYPSRFASANWTRPNCATDSIDIDSGVACDNTAVPGIVFNSSNRCYVLYQKLVGAVRTIYCNRWQ